MTAVTNDAFTQEVTDAYKGVEPMLWKIVTYYHDRIGGDLEEMIGIARQYFMEAVYTFKPEKGAFTTHVWNQVRFGLLNKRKEDVRHGGFAVVPNADGELVERLPSHKRVFDLHLFLGDLSEEAREVAQAALDLSTDTAPVSKEGLMNILREAGWATSEMLRAIKEIGEALL